jgi:aminoglycoside phosphotransferase (APT) family kinase protein
VTGEPALEDLRARAQRALRHRWPEAALSGLEPLTGGVSSFSFAASATGTGDDTRSARRVVVKVAPPGLPPVRNRDVLRQSRVIRGLYGTPGVRVPEVLGADDGSPPLFVMEFVPGESHEPAWDLHPRPPAREVIDARARAAARMLAALHAVAPARAGLADEPARSMAEELARWERLYATAGDDLRGDERSLAQALAARLPAPAPGGPRVVHGDYRLGNMQFEAGRLAAIIDWELWSVGDPRIDLAWLLMFARPVAQRVARRDPANQAAADAMPGRDDLLAEYLSARSGEEPSELSWFLAFSCYKLGAAMAVLAKRNRRLDEPDPGLELVAVTTPPMLAHGLEILGGPTAR